MQDQQINPKNGEQIPQDQPPKDIEELNRYYLEASDISLSPELTPKMRDYFIVHDTFDHLIFTNAVNEVLYLLYPLE